MNHAKSTLRWGLYVSIALTLLTVITFVLAMIAVPASGPNCPGNCMEYPYSDLLKYYPRDYYWMYLAIFQLFVFVVFTLILHHTASIGKKIFSSISVAFMLITTIVLLADYFIQFAVVPISMMKGELEGVALLTQYNDHGIFIALEELGYITLSIALFFLAPTFPLTNRLNKAIRWVLYLPLPLCILSFILHSLQFGIDRSYRFEVAAISIDWLFLITAGILISIYFKRRLKTEETV